MLLHLHLALQVGDIPLSSAQYNDFNEAYDGADGTSGGAMHIPLAVSSLSVYYNQQVHVQGLVDSGSTHVVGQPFRSVCYSQHVCCQRGLAYSCTWLDALSDAQDVCERVHSMLCAFCQTPKSLMSWSYLVKRAHTSGGFQPKD